MHKIYKLQLSAIGTAHVRTNTQLYEQHDDKWQILHSGETVGPQLQATDMLNKLFIWTRKAKLRSKLFIVRSAGDDWMSVDNSWNDTSGKTEALGGKPVPVPSYSPQIPHGLEWYWI